MQFTLTLVALILAGVAQAMPAPEPVNAALKTRDADSPDRSGGYSSTCNNVGLEHESDGWYLHGDCRTDNGGYIGTSLHLGDCIGNDNGQLVYEKNGAFGNSCTNEALTGTSLGARCGNGRGGYEQSSINLNTVVGNVNGNLVC